MTTGFYAGSFDPFTYGHLHVVKKSLMLFDKVIIGIATHPSKKRRFDKILMKSAIEKLIAKENLNNVSVIICSDNLLTADIALRHHSDFLVRGIRNGMDYEYEENLSSVNEETSNLDTIYIRAGNLGNVSSSMVMELMRCRKDVSKYLPPEILDVIQ